jgi:type I restriction enzyme S subunit
MVLIKPDKNKINGKYLLYALQSEFVQIQIQKSDKTGSIVSNLRIPVLEELRIPVFGTIIENKIGSIMDSIVSKIELNNRINSELEAMAKTLYDYWFVQFDFPNEEGKPYKTSGGAMVWNEELNREIPEGWEVKNLGDEIEIQRGVSYTSKEIEGEGIPMINLNSFKLNGVYKPEGIKSYSGKYSEKNIAKSGDLLIAATDVTRNADIIGRAILVPSYYENDLVFSMDIAKIISNTIPSSYLMMLFNSNHYHNYIKWYASGTIVLHLNLDGTNRYLTEIPPINLIQKFDILYQQISKRIDNTAIENQKLSSLRDWLLPMLMNGQVKVGE